MPVTTRKQHQQADMEEILADIPEYTTQSTQSTQEQTHKDAPDGDIFHDSISQPPASSMIRFDEDPMKEITLEMIFYEMKVIRYDINKKMQEMKDDILIQLQNENLSLKTEVDNLKQELSTKSEVIECLQTKLDRVANSKADLNDIIKLEREKNEMQQYIRRNNVEIVGIPDSVKQCDLESKVIEIGKAVNIEICPKEIEACHRLYQSRNQHGPKRTIVRFVNRKLAENLIKKGKEFKRRDVFEKANLTEKIYINNNLCSYYRFLWGKVKCLYNEKAIDSFWVFNGIINVRLNGDNGEVFKVTHLDDLIESFPDYSDLFEYNYN